MTGGRKVLSRLVSLCSRQAVCNTPRCVNITPCSLQLTPCRVSSGVAFSVKDIDVNQYEPATRIQTRFGMMERLESLERCDDKNLFRVNWADGESRLLPYIWLRDNCRCQKCFHATCNQRIVLMKNLDPFMQPDQAEISNASTLKITWPDGHIGEYSSTWLREGHFNDRQHDPIADIKEILWPSDMGKKVPKFAYDDVMSDDRVTFEWLKALKVWGLAIITDGPAIEDTINRIGERVCYLRPTLFGLTDHIKSTASNYTSLANQTLDLGLHIDLAHYNFCPGILMFHCIVQAKANGGDSTFSDTFKVAHQIKRDKPEMYKILTNTKLHFRSADFSDVHQFINETPVFLLDSDGKVLRTYYDDGNRAPYMNVPPEQVPQVYQALKEFNNYLYKEDTFIQIKLKAGETVTFNNNRVMHGRKGYTDIKGITGRHLQAGFIDWDEVHSRMRNLLPKALQNGDTTHSVNNNSF